MANKPLTKKQKALIKQMYGALLVITKDYQTPSQLRRSSGNEFGLEYEEALEMSYENIQQTAKKGIKGLSLAGLNKITADL